MSSSHYGNSFMNFSCSARRPLDLRQAVADKCKEPVFTQSEVAHMRSLWQQWSETAGHSGSFDWSIAPGQPYAIEALARLAVLLGDRDVTLWEALRRGVPTGVNQDIPLSNCFIPYAQKESWEPDMDFKICSGNWPGATANPDLLMELLEAELAKPVTWSKCPAWRRLVPSGHAWPLARLMSLWQRIATHV